MRHRNKVTHSGVGVKSKKSHL